MTESSGGGGPPAARGGPPPARGFPRDRLAGDTLEAARALLGARLVREPGPGRDPERARTQRRVGRIVEVEAYIGEDDRASHARMGPTPRNRVMFGPPGLAYVYLVYGMHHLLNVVTEAEGRPAAILIRAVEPVAGLDAMRAAREQTGRHRVTSGDARLAAGPAMVGAAFGIDRSDTGTDLCEMGSPLHLELAPDDEAPADVAATARIGVAYAGEPWTSLPWRFVIASSPSLSGRAARRARAGVPDQV